MIMEVTFANGVKSPRVQLGTFRLRGPTLQASISAGLEAGYRGIDTAAVYRNHSTIATSLRESLPKFGLERKDLFITSKLGPKDHGGEKCQAAIDRALEELETDYLDLFLIHWPGVQGVDVTSSTNAKLREESWRTLEENFKIGKLRSIGVSNYTRDHLHQLLETCQVVPHVLQVELHPKYQQAEVVKLCKEQGIHLQAYCSLGQDADGPLLTSPLVAKVAQKCGKTSAQVLLRWGLEKGYTVLPRSSSPSHVRENFEVLHWRLEDQDIQLLDTLGMEETKYAWNPAVVS